MKKKRVIIWTIALVILMLFSITAFAQNATPLKLSGYYKNLFTTSKTLADKKKQGISHLQRLRITGDYALTKEFSFHISYDNEILLHNLYDSPDFDLVRERDQRKLAWIDLDETIIDERYFYWKQSIYRLYAEYYTPKLRCIVGKQGVDWSRTRFYHPFDLFNPISPLDIEKEEKIGVDAINIDYYPEPFLMFNFIYAPYRNPERQGLGIRFGSKIADYDFFILAADVKKDKFIGASFDGYIKEAGFRGEYTYIWEDDGDNFLRGAVELDYSFTRKLYGIVEYFYNGGAKLMEIPRFLGSYDFSRRAFSVTKHIIGAGLEYEISGITKLNNYVFYDAEKNSFFNNPEFKWNIKPNFDLTFGAQVFQGDSNSEYGNYRNVYYAEMKMFF